MISQVKQKGFTIVELLVVIVVIAILAAISIVAYNNVTQKARDDQRVSDARSIVNAAASYQAEGGQWPTAAELEDYETVALSGSAIERMGTATVTSGNKDSNYKYVTCTSGSPAVNSGIRVYWYKEDGGTIEHLTTGTGTCPAN